MIEIKGAEKYVEFRSLPASATPGLGWTLIALYADNEYVSGPSRYDNQSHQQVTQPGITLVKTYALYGRTRDEVIENLKNANRDVQEDRDDKAEKLGELKTELETAIKELDQLRTSAIRQKELHTACDKLLQGATTSLRAMETDLGKVRDAVGGDRFKEILGRSTVKG